METSVSFVCCVMESYQSELTFSKAIKINWKDAEKALTKVYPRETGDDEDDIADPGSFFNFFEHKADPSEVSLLLVWTAEIMTLVSI